MAAADNGRQDDGAAPSRGTDNDADHQRQRPPRTVLVLQGGGALGAYQAGVFDALTCGGYTPQWIAGISIGAINAAIIAGNPPERQVERLRAFWEAISMPFSGYAPSAGLPRRMFNASNSLAAMVFGLPRFFTPRLPSPVLQPNGAKGATSFYDTSALLETLTGLVDFERINRGDVRLSLGAVNVETGNFAFFDNSERRIEPEHVLASGALPPGFPPVEIDGRFYWDGGLVSNTPLAHVLRNASGAVDTLVFQVDLWSTRGKLPQNLLDVEDRRKDIVYSSRTRLNTDIYRREFTLRKALATLAERLPEADRNDPELAGILELCQYPPVDVVHLIYKRKRYEFHSRDYDFSRASMREHWRAGEKDAEHALAKAAWREPGSPSEGMRVFDFT